MSKEFESIFITRQETVVLPKIKPIVVEGVYVAIKVKYSEPKFNQ
jgi:hypothetical protein